MTDHLGDDAELYALGLTDPDRTDAIEAHLMVCDACRGRVVAAEEAAGSFAAALPPVPVAAMTRIHVDASTTRVPFAIAAAAAVVFAVTAAAEGVVAYDASAQHAQTNTALLAVASSHFNHTTLRANPGVVAKVIYARDGSWCYIVTDGVPSGAHVLVHHGTTPSDLGALGGAHPATLFTRNPGRIDDITIVAAGTTIAEGVPAY